MNTSQYTQKTLEALQAAQQLAVEYQHNALEPEHLLHALATQEQGLIPQLLQKLNVDAGSFSAAVAEKLSAMPRVSGSGRDPDKVYISQATDKVLSAAAREAKAMKDDYVSVEHVFLALLDEQTQNTSELFRAFSITKDKFLQQLTAVRGNQRVTNDNPEDTYNALQKYGQDLVDLARKQKLDPVIGRDQEIRNVIRILSRKTKNNPCLIGEAGVGKTAIAEGIAERIAKGNVPVGLKDKEIFLLDLTSLVAGTQFRGQFEQRVKGLLSEVKAAGNVILFIDEIHTITSAGESEGAMNAGNILKPALSRGEIQVIGATTFNEYRKYIEKDQALERRFQPVRVEEPSVADTLAVMNGIKKYYEEHHHVQVPADVLNATVTLSERYITDRYLPDKAIDLLDEAASRVRVEGSPARTQVEASDVAEVVSAWTGVPASAITEPESERLLRLEEALHRRVVGQDEAVSAVARAIRRGRVGLADPRRPLGSFLFLGPTGVGKTELCRALAEAVYGDEEALIRLDMSEYMEKHAVSKLIGSPPGYVGYGEGGQLTERVRRRPWSVVLFDEIEKAHEDVYNLLLQIMEDGRLTDSEGRRADFRSTIVVMTSNVGAKAITENRPALGFSGAARDGDGAVREAVMAELRQTFRPEFLNRVDDAIVFRRLTPAEVRRIARGLTDAVRERMRALGVQLEVTDAALDLLAERGFDPTYGARPLRRCICTQLEDPAAEALLSGRTGPGDRLIADAKDGKLVLETR